MKLDLELCSHGNSLCSSPLPLDFNMLVIFSSKNAKEGHKLELTYFSCLLDHTYMYEAPFAKMKIERWRWPEMLLILGWSGTQYVAMVTKLLSSYRGAHLVESYCKEPNVSDKNWLRNLFSSYLITIWSSIWHSYLA